MERKIQFILQDSVQKQKGHIKTIQAFVAPWGFEVSKDFIYYLYNIDELNVRTKVNIGDWIIETDNGYRVEGK